LSEVEDHDKEVYADLLKFWKAHPWLLNDQLFTQCESYTQFFSSLLSLFVG